jgi:outer membrane murein-binding lipoprotein Lpp
MRMRVNSEVGERARIVGSISRGERLVMTAMLLILGCHSALLRAQTGSAQATAPETAEQKIDRLTAAVAQAQAQMDAYQKELLELRRQLTALQQQMAAEKAASPEATQTAPGGPGGCGVFLRSSCNAGGDSRAAGSRGVADRDA